MKRPASSPRKVLGTIKAAAFYRKVLSLLDKFQCRNSHVSHVQDNLPCHVTGETVEALYEMGLA